MKKIYAVGLGPGSIEQMTLRAVRAIEECEVVCGYGRYIKLIEPLIRDKEVFSAQMCQEAERCRKAFEYALKGKTTAVISSGDCGVYGMSGLIYELGSEYPEVEIEVIPGVTACCGAGAVIGAPLTHDFAVISLSDCLTPWELIEKRLRLAAEGDFVICIYNPSSKKRAAYLSKACDIILSYRRGDTPCGCVKNAGRDGEEYRLLTLSELRQVQTDMLTTVFIGSSSTKIIGGKLVTPRGYRL